MKNYSTPLQLVRYAKAFAAASDFAHRHQWTFRIAAISDKPNAFGLHGYILICRTGEAYQVARSIGPWNPKWSVGQDIAIPRNINGQPSFVGCEIPSRMPDAPASVLKALFS